jgi:hypothetical protein
MSLDHGTRGSSIRTPKSNIGADSRSKGGNRGVRIPRVHICSNEDGRAGYPSPRRLGPANELSRIARKNGPGAPRTLASPDGDTHAWLKLD